MSPGTSLVFAWVPLQECTSNACAHLCSPWGRRTDELLSFSAHSPPLLPLTNPFYSLQHTHSVIPIPLLPPIEGVWWGMSPGKLHLAPGLEHPEGSALLQLSPPH